MLSMFLFASCALDIVQNGASRKVGGHLVVKDRDEGWIRDVSEYREVTKLSVRPLGLVEEEERARKLTATLNMTQGLFRFLSEWSSG